MYLRIADSAFFSSVTLIGLIVLLLLGDLLLGGSSRLSFFTRLYRLVL